MKVHGGTRPRIWKISTKSLRTKRSIRASGDSNKTALAQSCEKLAGFAAQNLNRKEGEEDFMKKTLASNCGFPDFLTFIFRRSF